MINLALKNVVFYRLSSFGKLFIHLKGIALKSGMPGEGSYAKQVIPAACAASRPAALSSMTARLVGSVLNSRVVCKNKSGAVLPLGMSKPEYILP